MPTYCCILNPVAAVHLECQQLSSTAVFARSTHLHAQGPNFEVWHLPVAKISPYSIFGEAYANVPTQYADGNAEAM